MAFRALTLLAFAAGLLWTQTPVQFICPMDPEVRSAGPGKCSKCGMKLEPGIREQVEYPLHLQVTPKQIPAGRELQLAFHVTDPKTGAPVTKFEVVHEKLFHLFIVGQDLEYFAHVHPEPRPDGSFLFRTTLPKAGAYRLLSDYYPSGGVPQLTPKTITTAGYIEPLVPAQLKPDMSAQRGENLEVELTTDPPQPIAGKKTLMFFKLKPADGIEPYLGAWGHMLAVSDDLIDMNHIHPFIADGGPQVQFDVYFPREASLPRLGAVPADGHSEYGHIYDPGFPVKMTVAALSVVLYLQRIKPAHSHVAQGEFKMKRMRLIVFLTMFFLHLPVFAQQGASAGIYGSVYDSQGAIVPRAKVTLTQLSTNQARNAVSNEVGQFQFPLIPVGSYRIAVENPGFKKFEQTGIQVQVNDNLKVDVTLELGEISSVVKVDASGIAVETSSAALKETVDSKRVVELPLNGRNLADLALLVPGVQAATGVNGDVKGSSYSARGSKEFSVNGSRQNNLKFTLDGGDNQDNLFNANQAFPFPDAVQEFSVQTSNSLEIGKSSGGAVNIVTKSGTNEYHGDVFWFIRNTNLNANSFFSRAPDQLKRNQTGATLGGPVLKNKLFLFGGYQRTWLRQAAGDGRALTMPAAFRSGNFSSLLPGTVITDGPAGAPFPGNIIPQSRQSPAAQALLKFSPLPDPDGFTRYTSLSQEDTNDYVVRGDYRPSVKHSFLGRYFQQDFLNPRPMAPNNLHSVQRGIAAYTKNASVGYTLVANPSLIADTHFTMSRQVGKRTSPFPNTIADFGVKVNPSSTELDVVINGPSNLNLSTVRPAIFARTNLEMTHSWRLVRGRHNMVWGADLQWSRYNEYNVFNGSGVYRFNGRITGFDQADYILGAMSQFRQSNGEIEFRRYHYQGFYFADTMRVSRTLTLNFGLRWEPYTPITDLKDREIQFRPEEYSKGTKSPHFVNAPPGLFFPGDKLSGFTIPKAGTGSDLNNLGPRFGFAWDAGGNGKTSVRGGYGIFYDTPELWLLNNMNAQTPFSFLVQFPDGNFDNPYAGRQSFNVFPFAGDFDPKTPFQIPFDTTALESKFVQAYVQNWNLTVERKLGNDWLLRVGYVGTKATHLMADYDQNAPLYNFSQTLNQNLASIDQRRPRADYQRISTLFTGLNQFYSSLQTSLNKRFSRGFTVLASYTFSKNMDYNSRNNNVLDNVIANPFNFFWGRGVADNDHPHRFVTSFLWDLPGKSLDSLPLRTILANWQLGGIVTLQSGRPFSILSSSDRAALNASNNPRADVVGNLALADGRSRGARIDQYFDISAVTQAAPGTFGTLGRNTLRGPGYANLDMSIAKSIPLKFREAAKLTFRGEAFNLFNRPQLSTPNNRVGVGGFGKITSTDGDPRILQFGLKVDF